MTQKQGNRSSYWQLPPVPKIKMRLQLYGKGSVVYIRNAFLRIPELPDGLVRVHITDIERDVADKSKLIYVITPLLYSNSKNSLNFDADAIEPHMISSEKMQAQRNLIRRAKTV